MEDSEITQNAIYIYDTKEVVISTYRHDYKSFTVGDKKCAIDGGNYYIRWAGPVQELIDNGVIANLIIDENMTPSQAHTRLVWGVYQGSTDSHKHYRLYDLSTEHLSNILKTQSISKFYKECIDLILESRLPEKY